VHLLLTHISRMTEDYRSKIPSTQYFREKDYAYWTSPETKMLAGELGIVFIGYRDLQRLQARNWGRESPLGVVTTRDGETVNVRDRLGRTARLMVRSRGLT
jgi:hypothetical protein